jgi:high-affinity nickel-transport protein
MNNDVLLPLIALSVGIKHGVDWDHVAAIMDITATQQSRRKGVLLSFLYAIGHASVVAALTLGALIIGLSLPEGIDGIMEKVVGITLLLLGLYVLYSLHTYREGEFRIMPRWAIVANAILRAYDWSIAKLNNAPMKQRSVWKGGYGGTSAYVIGMIHGIGAETPTQVMLFALTLGTGAAAGKETAILLILSFVSGLIITNTVMGILGAYGIATSANRDKLYRGVALVIGIFSLTLGAVFLFGGADFLPDLQALI